MVKTRMGLSVEVLFERLPFFVNIFLVMALVYFVILLFTTPFYLHRMQEPEVKKSSSNNSYAQSFQDLNYYASIVEAHPLFGVKQQQVIQPTRSACDDFKTKYLLSGIVSGNENEAILNDRSTKETRFVKAGENLDGVAIDQIKTNSVLLNCSGKQLEIAIEGN